MVQVSSNRAGSLLGRVSPVAMARNLWRFRALTLQFTRREIEGRYRGSFLGLLWSFITPLVLLLVYTFVFGVIFQSRWPEARSGDLNEFAVIIFAGLLTFNLFSEVVTRAPSLVVSVPNYVKKVVFPLEILPVAALGAALFHAGVSLLILLGAHLLSGGVLHWTLLLLPVVLLPLLLLALGIAWFLASLGVYIRDIGNAIGLVVQVLFFLSPIFYTAESVPEPFRSILLLNPLSPVIEHVRRVTLWGELPAWSALSAGIIGGAAVMLAGYAWFRQTSKGFADVL